MNFFVFARSIIRIQQLDKAWHLRLVHHLKLLANGSAMATRHVFAKRTDLAEFSGLNLCRESEGWN